MIAGLLGLAAPAAFAQQGHVAGPVAGYVFDGGSRVVRPVLGIPGASVLGDPVDLGIGVTMAAVAPRLDSLLAVGADGSFHIFSLNTGTAKESGVSGIAASPERLVFSPTGSSAALYAGGKIQIVTGLPASPAAGSTFDLSSLLALPGGHGHRPLAGSFAVSDDGAYLLVAEGAGVQLFGPGGTRQIVSTRNTAVTFLPGSHDAAVAGSGVTLLKDVGGAATAQVLADSDPALNSLGLAYSADGAKLYLASSQGVAAFDLASGTRTAIPCDCSPAGITGMGNLFRLNDAGQAPLWLLDANAATPRIVFVPVRSE
jgi:hypothetical protein